MSPSQTTVTSRSKASVSVTPEGTVSISGPSGVTLVLSANNQMNMTTADGTQVSLSEKDSLLLENTSYAIVVFPNAIAMVVTKEEIISLVNDGTVIVTDSTGSLTQMSLDKKGVPCSSKCL